MGALKNINRNLNGTQPQTINKCKDDMGKWPYVKYKDIFNYFMLMGLRCATKAY